ncbi:hypothetical protein, conserved [Eimeria acervulina]|uniref:Uncharacterized protein n=1 Tax=Eimeria acervulina TaxID=5801 RepID=U6GK57_EIMAC|nr:hypothetical protein, conserved [Eimeria acervulina]CDI79977.1 hypothetical protein, conserved [Eimeria acervulina]
MRVSDKTQQVESRRELRAATPAQEYEGTAFAFHGGGCLHSSTRNTNNPQQRNAPQEDDEAVESIGEYMHWIDEAEAYLEELHVEAFIERDGSHISLELMASLNNYGSIYLFASEKSVLVSEAVLAEKA